MLNWLFLVKDRLVAPFALLLACLLVLTQSPNQPFSSWYPLTDSSVFQYIGSSMLDGLMPYRDIFDHKGPLLYLTNAASLLLNAQWGVWAVELVSLFSTALLWYATLRKIRVSKWPALLVSGLALLFVGANLQGGNLPEEYALPLLSLVVYVCIPCDNGKRSRFVNAFTTGAACSFLFMLKFTVLIFAVPYLVACAFWFDADDGRKFLKGFLPGLIVPLVLVFVWLLSNGAADSFLSDYFFYNSNYAGHSDVLDRILSLLTFSSDFLFLVVVIISVTLIGFRKRQVSALESKVLIVNLAGLCLGFIVTAGTGYVFGHYALLFTPFYIIPLGCAYKRLAGLRSNGRETIYVLCSILLLWGCVIPLSRQAAEFSQSIEAESFKKAEVVDKIVSLGVRGGDEIAVVGNDCWIYLKTRTHSASQYAYLPAYVSDYESWFDEIKSAALSKKVPLVVIDNRFVSFADDAEFSNRFQLTTSDESFSYYTAF